MYTNDYIAALNHNSQKVEAAKYLPTDGWINKTWYIHKMENYSAIKKEWNTDTCQNMDILWKHAKWKNLVIKDHILYDFINMKIQNRETYRDRK